MDSGPRTSPEAPGLGPAIAARVRPRLGIGRRSPLTRVSIGGMARTIAGFGRSLGLARSARPTPIGGLSQATVRPPVGYWPWAESLEPAVVTTAPPSTRPTPTRAPSPATVGSGDAKVDSLRRLLGLPPLVMSPPETKGATDTGSTGDRTQSGTANATVTRAGRRAGTTVAGTATGPGRLGRRLVPETVRADPSTSSVLPTAPQGAPTTTAPRSPSARGTRDVETLQRALAASGKLSNPRDGRDGGDGTSPASTGRAAARQGNGSGGRGTAVGRDGTPSSVTTTMNDITTSDMATQSSRTSSRDYPPAATATTMPVLQGLDRMADGLTTTTDQPIARSVTAADAVRLRRLIRQTPHGNTNFVPYVDNAVVRPTGLVLDQGLSAGEHDVAIAPLPTEARRERVPTPRATNLTPHDVLRRVSLPRTMSRRDRPLSSLTAAVMRRRHEATMTEQSPAGRATISAGGQASPTPGADGRPLAPGRSQTRTDHADRADRADRSVVRRWDTPPSGSRRPLVSIAPDGLDPSAASIPSITTSSTTAPFSPTTAIAASSRDETVAAATVLRRAIAGDVSRASVERASIRPPSRSTSAELSTFSAAVDRRRFVTEADRDVAAVLLAGEPMRWPSPGTMFASAMLERRATDTAVSPGARRSVVSPGPGALRSVVRSFDSTAETSTTTGHAAARDASRDASTRDRPLTATAAAAARRVRTERAPETFADIVTSHRDDGHRYAAHAGAAPPGATVAPPSVRTASPRREQVAARFLTELSRGERRHPQPLPAPYRPMAEAITGHHRVLISTDDASRRALRSVNKIAATTGDVIHLAAPPAVGARNTELLAHELTHVAHPSPAPRFFADDDRGPEERRADEIARVIARSPLAPTASIGRRATSTSVAATRTSTDQVIRRSTASRSKRAQSTSGTVSAAVLAEQITSGAMRPSSPAQAMRWVKGVVPKAPPVRPATSVPPVAPPTDTSTGSSAFWDQLDSTEGGDWFRRQLQANFDRIVRLLEHHVIGELERRGGRTWKGY